MFEKEVQLGMSELRSEKDYEKLYLLLDMDLDQARGNGRAFANPNICLGRGASWGSRDGGKKWAWNTGDGDPRVVFQVSLYDYDDGRRSQKPATNPVPYSARVSCDLFRVDWLAKTLAQVNKQVERLAPGDKNPLTAMIVGFRALGYREAILEKDSSYIVELR